MTKAILPVILSGGSGTRLWPMSTSPRPKQFLALTGTETMFQMTCQRCRDKRMFASPLIIGNELHADLANQQLAQIGEANGKLVLEPMGRNTAPAIALAALEAGGDDTVLLVMPSDHVIEDEPAFTKAVTDALPAAQAGWLVSFGIVPTGPHTGYGYIEMSDEMASDSPARKATRFVEKPPLEHAKAMLETGKFAWNAGIFLFRSDAFLKALRDHSTEILKAVTASHAAAERTGNCIYPDTAHFAASPSDSIDYAVMEKAANVAVMPVDCGWSDLGSWDALLDIADKDEGGNSISGNVLASDTSHCLIRSDGVQISVKGVSDLLIIASGNDIIILPRGTSQEVKAMYERRKSSD